MSKEARFHDAAPFTCLAATLDADSFIINRIQASAPSALVPCQAGDAFDRLWVGTRQVRAWLKATRVSGLPATQAFAVRASPQVSVPITCTPLLDAQSNCAGLLCTIVLPYADNAAEIPRTAALPSASEHREAQIQYILDSLPLGVVVMDQQQRIVFMNAVQRQLSAVPDDFYSGDPTTIMARPVPDLLVYPTLSPVKRSELPGPLAMKTGKMVTREFQRPSDGTFWHVTAQPVVTAGGEPNGIIVVSLDLTSQYHARQAAIHKAQEMDAIIDSIGDGVILFDAAGQIQRLNQAALRLLGWQPGYPDPREQSPFTPAWMQSIVDAESAAPIVTTVMRYDHQRITISVNVTPWQALDTAARGWICAFRDITEIIRADRLKDEFISMAGHELQAPLASLLLSVRILQRRAQQPGRQDEVSALLDEVANHAKRLSRMIESMLDLSRINSGHFNLRLDECDLSHIVRSAVEEQHQFWRRTIVIEGADLPVQLRVDGERIWQVCTNLISNALKYSPETAPVIVTLTTQPEVVHIVIRDAGVGIAPEHLQQLFQPYFRVPRLMGAHPDGLGLGLTIARAIVEEHGGRILVESVPDVGSTFTIALPRILS